MGGLGALGGAALGAVGWGINGALRGLVVSECCVGKGLVVGYLRITLAGEGMPATM